jgi:hypothetical protein
MSIYRKESSNYYGGCLFCTKGELRKDGKGLKYPYQKVYVISGNNLEIRICKECLDKIKKIK